MHRVGEDECSEKEHRDTESELTLTHEAIKKAGSEKIEEIDLDDEVPRKDEVRLENAYGDPWCDKNKPYQRR
jgi:hypothetical protein